MENQNRRSFLGSIVSGSSVALSGPCLLSQLEFCAGSDSNPTLLAWLKGGTKIKNLEFERERRVAVGNVTGKGLAGRLALDLASITEKSLTTRNDQHFIRTRVPDGLDSLNSEPWGVQIDGLVNKLHSIPFSKLNESSKKMGTFVMECSGNGRGRAFGLMSAAAWDGVSITSLLKKISVKKEATRVLISGIDHHSVEPEKGIESRSSRGASWTFSFEDLKNTNAFLATRMNGSSIPKDHGYPIRLFVPGWYGCTCSKWVDRITLVDDSCPSTIQMREFASRTHQSKRHHLAKDFRPAEMDLAAMPIRVEQWKTESEEMLYRVIGIMWGGKIQTKKLMIQFGRKEKPTPVESYNHQQNSTWTLWQHTWKPISTGQYSISMSIDDPEIRTRRLDRGYYTRLVKIKHASQG